jgi:hypothetical protein
MQVIEGSILGGLHMPNASSRIVTILFLFAISSTTIAADPTAELPLNSWVKLTPVADSPPSPRLGYEGDCRWDPKRQLMIRYGGHNQGGGGEQGSEVFLFDPRTGKWEMREPNMQPPGVCCAQQNVFDPSGDRYIRFPAFSHSHGWQWKREIDLNNWSVWTYDIGGNTWRNMRPVPSPQVSPLRCASWDSDHQVIVLFGGEGNSEGTLVYDPYTNTWTRMKPKEQPEFRSGGSMAYDEARKLHILFGSQFSDDPHTWAYDLKKNEWRDLKPTTMPPTKENDAVLAYDPVSRLIIALVKQTEKRKRAEPKKGEDEFEEIHSVATWAFDAGKNAWTKLEMKQEPDAAGYRTRQLMWAAGLNALLLENCPGKPREQQVWAFRVAETGKEKADQPPKPPGSVRVRVDAKGATVSWEKALQGAGNYAIFAGDVPAGEPWKAEMKPVGTAAGDALQWRDDDAGAAAKAGLVRHYAVRARAADNSAGEASMAVRSQPRVIEDVVASVLGENRVEVRWPKAGDGIIGYWIERAPV